MHHYRGHWQALIGCVALLLGVTVLGAFSQRTATAAVADFTVLVYSHGDNDLDGGLVGPGDLNEMTKQADKVNFVVYHDRNAAKDDIGTDEQHLDLPVGYSGGYVFRVGADGRAKEVQNLGEPYTMSPQTLSWFVYYGLTKYPARNTILVLDDHGGGPAAYFGSPEDDTPKEDPNSILGPMTLGQVTAALRSGIDAATKDGWQGGSNGMRLDGIVQSTCLNGNYEAMRSLAPLARYAWGAETVTIGDEYRGAWDINYTASAPIGGNIDNTLGYLQALVEGGPAIYLAADPPQLDFSNAIFDLDQIKTIDTAMRTFVQEVAATDGYRFLLEARTGAMFFFEKERNLYDLGDLLARISSAAPSKMLVARNAVYLSIEKARRYLATNGPSKGARGLSIYFPSKRNGMGSNYQQLADSTGWTRLIRDTKVTGASPLGQLTLAGTPVGNAWKATLSSQGAFPVASEGFFGLGLTGGSKMQILATIDATIGAGGATKAQAVGTFHSFTLGSSPVSLTFSRDLSTAGFRAIWVLASSGKQSIVRGSVSAKFASGSWTFGIPNYIVTVEGSIATVTPGAKDLIAPLVSYFGIAPTSKDSSTFQFKAVPIPQRGVAGTSKVSAAPLASATSYILFANIWDETFKTAGDLVIEQTPITKP